MKISHLQSDPTPPARRSETRPKPPASSEQTAPTTDTFQPAQKEKLLAALASTPEIRPEHLARARELLAREDYPAPDVVRTIAERLLSS